MVRFWVSKISWYSLVDCHNYVLHRDWHEWWNAMGQARAFRHLSERNPWVRERLLGSHKSASFQDDWYAKSDYPSVPLNRHSHPWCVQQWCVHASLLSLVIAIQNHLWNFQDQCQRFMDHFDFFLDMTYREQILRLKGNVPSIEDFWSYRLGTSAMGIMMAVNELGFSTNQNGRRCSADNGVKIRLWRHESTHICFGRCRHEAVMGVHKCHYFSVSWRTAGAVTSWR